MNNSIETSDKGLMCRLCMKSENVMLMDIFEEDVNRGEGAQVPLPLKIMACLDIQVDSVESKSHYLCHRCVYKVDLFYDFKEMCKQTNINFIEGMRKQHLYEQEDTSSCDASEDMENEDEPTVMLVPLSHSSKPDNTKDPLALSDNENSSVQLLDNKPSLFQESSSSVEIEEVIRQQREHFNKSRQVQANFLNLETAIKQQRAMFKCREMSESEKLEKVKQMIKAPMPKTYCRLCHRSFPTKDFTEHMKAHRKRKQVEKCKKIIYKNKKIYCCPLCTKIFFMKYSLERHLLLHKRNKDFQNFNKMHQCPICKKTFTVGFSLKRHMIIHSGERPFKCTVCNRSFSDRSNLLKHVRTHTQDRPFTCRICPAKFQFKSYLMKHLRQHLNNRRLINTPDHECYTKKVRPEEQIALFMSTKGAHLEDLTCLRNSSATESSNSKQEQALNSDNESEDASTNTKGPPFEEKLQINTMVATKRQKSPKKQTVIPKEPKVIPVQVQEGENTANSVFKCRNCQTTFPTYEQLVKHRKIHSGVSGFRCILCQLLFQSQSALTRHIMVRHSKCHFCEKAFLTKYECLVHEDQHKHVNKYVCGICNQIFLSIDGLSLHMMKHNLEGPFKCVLCNNEFFSRPALQMHYKICCRQMKKQAAAKSCND